MIITLEQLQNAEEQKIYIDFFEKIDEINPEKEVKANLTAWLRGTMIEVFGDIEATVEMECDRCLAKFSKSININIKEIFTTCEAFDYSHNEIELKNDNFVVELDTEGKIDVSDLVYQSVILNLPSQKICSENCEGLPVFTKDSASEDENKESKIDPRLAIFQGIKISKKEEK